MKMILKKINWPRPEVLAAFVGKAPGRVWLDSALAGHPKGKISILTAPFLGEIRIDSAKKGWLKTEDQEREISDPYRFLDHWLGRLDQSSDGKRGFWGGAVGYLSYDSYGSRLKRIPPPLDSDLPEAYFILTDTGILMDHGENQVWAYSWGMKPNFSGPDPELGRSRVESLLHELELDLPRREEEIFIESVENGETRDSYLQKIHLIKEAIFRGDCYQINLAQKFLIRGTWQTSELYLRLRENSPAPLMAFFNLGSSQILSASPEILLETRQGVARSYPIKGTRPRHAEKMKDWELRNELFHSPKDGAELLMIIDLVRNDLGKVCQLGSVRVPQLKELDSLPQVHHLWACVEGRLRKEISPLDALLELSPGGSVTGAPKFKAMEMIRRLESHPRGIYTGSIGYLGFNGDSCFNLSIRTATVKKNSLEYFSGGGIVADSNPEAEYQETLDKARGLFQSLGIEMDGTGAHNLVRGVGSCRV